MNVKKVILLDEAIGDLERGRTFYEERAEGIGTYFVTSLLADVSSLRLYSGIHPIRFDYHRMLSKRFPFSIYYDIASETCRVVAILDMRQNPRIIRTTLQERKS